MELNSKKPSLLSRLRSTLDKDTRARSHRKKQHVQSLAGRLPQELAECIIDHLWYHLDSLLACCLTCRAWVEPSRYHLFYRRKLIYEHQYKPLAILRRHGLVDYIRRIELDLLPPFTKKSPTFRYLKDMGSAPSLRALTLTDYNVFDLPESTRLAQATVSLVTLELVSPGGSPSDILEFICMFPNLENLLVAKYYGRSAKLPPRCETSPSFSGVLSLKHVIGDGENGFVQGLLSISGGLRFQELILNCNTGVESLIPACSGTLRTLFYRPRLEADVDAELYDLSRHILLERVETVVCSKTSLVPPVYLNLLTSEVSSPKFRDLIITTHDHDFPDLFLVLSTIAEKVTSNLSKPRYETPNVETRRPRITFNIEDPLWSSRDRDELVREICPVILQESETVVVVQKRGSDWGVCRDQPGLDMSVFLQ